MPLTTGTPVGSVMKDLLQDQQRCHLVIHEAFPNYNGNDMGHIIIQDMPFRVSLIGKDGKISSSSSNMRLSGSCAESMLNKAADLETVKRFLYDCTAMDAEKDPSWRPRTSLQKCIDVNVNTSHNEYYGYLSQQSANPMSQIGFYNQGLHPHVGINGSVHGPVHPLPMPYNYNLQSISQNEFVTQEKTMKMIKNMMIIETLTLIKVT